MLHHPFFGIIDPDAREANQPPRAPATHEPHEPLQSGRRSFFGHVMTGALGGWALLTGRTASAQQLPATTEASGDARAPVSSQPPSATPVQYGGGGGYTTQALGEEGGTWRQPRHSYYPPRGTVTTYAVGEEGSYGYWPPRYPPRYPPRGVVTTYAVGEEAGYGRGYPQPYRTRRPNYYYYRY